MANIKSAKKRIVVSQIKGERNKAIKSEIKTAVKKVYAAIDANDKAAAKEALTNATSLMESACSKGVYHKNTVARKISRMSVSVNKMA